MRIRVFVIAFLLGAAATSAAFAGDSQPAATSSKDDAQEISCTLVECHTAAQWAALKKHEAKKHASSRDDSANKQASASGD